MIKAVVFLKKSLAMRWSGANRDIIYIVGLGLRNDIGLSDFLFYFDISLKQIDSVKEFLALKKKLADYFDDKDKTFIDLYMKSGLYITEIIERLYQSETMKKEFPDDKERLKHIFEKQVYGLASTEIIYKMATSYILGFADNTDELAHNFRQIDALPYAKDGTLQEVLDREFGEGNN